MARSGSSDLYGINDVDFAHCGIDRDVAEFYRPSSQKSMLRAENLRQLLEKKVAMLPGGRDRRGGPIMCFPCLYDTERLPIDDLMLLIKYLSYLPDKKVSCLRFTVVIDMRHTTLNCVKPILRVLDDTLSELMDITYVIKPEKYFEEQRMQMAISKYNFDIKLVNIDGLFADIDPAQLTSEFQGSLPFDCREWVELRCRLENFFALSNEMSDKLRLLFDQMDHHGTPGTLAQASQLVELHRAQKSKILQAPVHSLEAEAASLAQWLRCRDKGDAQSSQRWVCVNTDLQELAPRVADAIQSLYELQSLLVDKWQSTRMALEEAHFSFLIAD